MKRESVVFYGSWKKAIDRLGDGQRGAIYEMILDYAIDGKAPKTDDPVALMIFDLVRVQIEVNNQRYENGKKGGRPKKITDDQAKQSSALRNKGAYKEWREKVFEKYGEKCAICGSSDSLVAHHIRDVHEYPDGWFDVDNGVVLCGKCHAKVHSENYSLTLDKRKKNLTITEYKPSNNLKKTNNKPNVNVNVNENVNVSNNNARARTRESQIDMFDRLTVGRALNKDMKKALQEWIDYKSERKEQYKEAGMRTLISQAVNLGAAYGGAAVCDAIHTSMASGYKGIIWDRMKKKQNKPPERNYDMDSLELKLLATN